MGKILIRIYKLNLFIFGQYIIDKHDAYNIIVVGIALYYILVLECTHVLWNLLLIENRIKINEVQQKFNSLHEVI